VRLWSEGSLDQVAILTALSHNTDMQPGSCMSGVVSKCVSGVVSDAPARLEAFCQSHSIAAFCVDPTDAFCRCPAYACRCQKDPTQAVWVFSLCLVLCAHAASHSLHPHHCLQSCDCLFMRQVLIARIKGLFTVG
jgi:hypothetical protein